MKKIALLLSFLLCAFFSFAQFPNDVSTSNSQTLFHYKGALIGDKSIMIPVLDTLLNAATPYRGALTVRPQDSLLYMSDGVNWHPFVSSTNGWIVDSIYVERPIAIKIGTSGASNGKQVIYFLKESGLISGGIPFSTGCRTLTMPPSIYNIGFNQYTSLATDLTIDTSHATLNRTDRIVGDTFGIISVLKGTNSVLGLPPPYNPSSQFSLALISVPAASTCTPPSATSKTLYDENLGVAGGEWDVTTEGAIAADADNTDNPLHLTKAIFISTYVDSSQLILTGLQDTATSTSVLVLPTYLNNRLTNPIQVQFFSNTTAVSNNTIINSYINTLDTGQYQVLVIPFTAFNFSSTIFNKIVFTFRDWDTSGAAGLYFDWIRIQKGIAYTNEANRYVDSTKIIAGFEYYYKAGIPYLAGAVGGGSSGNTINIYNDTTLLICSMGTMLCDTFIVNNIGAIQIVTVLNDSTLEVCDSTGLVCDTLHIPQTNFYTGATSVLVYNENVAAPTEWPGTFSGSATSNFNGLTNPFIGLKTTDIGSYSNSNQTITYTSDSTVSAVSFNNLTMEIRLKAAMANNANIQLAFLNGSTVVSSTVTLAAINGFNKAIVNSYQAITVPFSSFTFPGGSNFNKLRITLVRSSSGMYIDYIRLHSGTNIPPSSTTTVVSFAKNATRDSMILTLSDGTRYAILDSTGGGTTQRFGIEDNTGVQDRSIDMDDFSFSMEHAPYFLFEADNIANTQYGILYAQSGDAGEAKAEIGAASVGGSGSTIRANLNGIKFLHTDGSSVQNTFKIPDNSLPANDSATLAISVNGNYADATGNVTISTGGSSGDADSLGGLPASNYWRTIGNSGTTSGTNFIGTTDNQSFKFRVNNSYAGMFDSLQRFVISKTDGVKGGSYRYGLWSDSAVVIGDTSQWKPYTTSANNTLAPFVNIRKDWNGSTIFSVENQNSGDRARAALAVLGETAFGVTPDVNNRYGLMQVTSTTRNDTSLYTGLPSAVIVPANTFMFSSGGGLAGGLILYSDNGPQIQTTNLHLNVPPHLYISSFSNPDGTSRNVPDTNYVGIHTRNPSSLLHVGNGTLSPAYVTVAYGSASGNTGGLAFKSGTGYTPKWTFQANTSATLHDLVVQEGTNSTNKIRMLQGTTGDMFLNESGGNVQVGTTSTPTFLMEVNKSQNAATTLGILNGTNGTAATSTLWLGESSGGNYSLLRHYARANTGVAPYEGGSLLLQNSSDGNVNYVTYGAFGHKFWVDNATGTAFNPISISQAGHLLFNTNNTYDISTSAARVRTGYFGTSIFNPLYVGGITTTSTITYKTTSGVGTTGADHIWVGGNNGATEFMRILNDGSIGIGTASPDKSITLAKSSTGQVAMDMLNAGTGTASTVNLFMGEGATLTGLKYAGLNYYNNSYTTSGAAIANSIRLFSETTVGLTITANHATGAIRFYTGGVADANERMRIDAAGNVGIGLTTITSLLHLKAGTSTASTAPLKFTSGTNLTAPEAGAVEFDGTNYFVTSSTTRYTLAKTLTATATLDFGSTLAGTVTDLTITVTGAADGDVVDIGVPNGSYPATGTFAAWVSAANTITIRYANNSLTLTQDPASGTFRATVFKY